MPKVESQKIKLLVLFDILKKYSDEDNPLSLNEIIDYLDEYGIETGKRVVADDIQTLNDYGYEILTVKGRGNTNLYTVVDRRFDVPELKILIDAVQSANFITEKKTKELTEKIAELGGVNKAKQLTQKIVYSDTAKQTNEKIYYSVDKIDCAILNNKKVSFKYFDLDCHGLRIYRKEGKRYVVNPVSLIFNENKYYLTCYSDKYMNLSNYRVDKMDDVIVENEDITPSDIVNDFNANSHKKQAFSMYIGKPEKVVFEVKNSALDVIYDKFGMQSKFSNYSEDSFKFTANVCLSPTFFAWCVGLGKNIKILEPTYVRKQYSDYLRSIADFNDDIPSGGDRNATT